MGKATDLIEIETYGFSDPILPYCDPQSLKFFNEIGKRNKKRYEINQADMNSTIIGFKLNLNLILYNL